MYPSLRAKATACARLRRWSRVVTPWITFLTVRSEYDNLPAISPVSSPSAISRTTSTSRGVSPSEGPPCCPTAPRWRVPTWLSRLPSRSAGRSPSPREAASTAETSRRAVASWRQTMAPTPHSTTSSNSRSWSVPTTRAARAPSPRTIRRSRPTAFSSSAFSTTSATVPGADSSRSSTSGRRRNWLTAPSLLMGSAATTATGTGPPRPPSGAGVEAVHDELSNRHPLFTSPPAGADRRPPGKIHTSAATGPGAIVDHHEAHHETGAGRPAETRGSPLSSQAGAVSGERRGPPAPHRDRHHSARRRARHAVSPRGSSHPTESRRSRVSQSGGAGSSTRRHR
ncbi:Hypothetical protein XNRR2_0531 [Streptomyces albidoflavus]|nr:Hypothetical protein XNR_0531 [Streptomyces albidoflavus]QLP90704.1 Hypothetical protein XNRR2_0531 [Streptomyces albidoflavus]WAE09209.1 Hypothetical protein SAD14_0531 [Streptomyces albidoflavus]WAE14850.1 Hypothetical protein SAD14N_0531 [Streptomyces albidoflavus]